MRAVFVALSFAACSAHPHACDLVTPSGLYLGDLEVAAPPSWTATRRGDRLIFTDPDHAVTVTVMVDTGTGDVPAAIAAAWRSASPLVTAEAASPEDAPDAGAWDAVTTVRFTPAHRARVAFGRAYRSGAYRILFLVDADSTAFDRREADIDVLAGSLHVPGLREQTLGKRRPLDRAQLDAFVDRALADLAVPGAAIAVLDGNTVVYERTVGVRELGATAPVTPSTRFLLASITKPMTTLMEAALVDAGVVRWDSPVTSILPDFAVGDAEVTRQLQLWHMSCACTGMPRQDLEDLFEWDGITPEARLAQMRTMAPTTKLGETFQYSNLMVAAGGFIAAHAYRRDLPLADAYAAAMQAKVFGPIGMTSTTLDQAVVARGDHATPHALALDGTTRTMPLAIERDVEPIAPAGGVWTTLRDMERYVATELGDGVAPDGTRVVSAANMHERVRPRVRSSATGSYGLGIGVAKYSGTLAIRHDGGAFGFGTTMFTLPTEGVGIIIFTNVRNGSDEEQLPFNAAVQRRIVELMFDAATPVAERKLAFYAKVRAEHTSQRAAHAHGPAGDDHAWVAPLVGDYHDPALGDLAIHATAAGADLDAGEWHSAVHREVHDGAATLVLEDPPFAGTPFAIEADGSITIPGYPGYRFTRKVLSETR